MYSKTCLGFRATAGHTLKHNEGSKMITEKKYFGYDALERIFLLTFVIDNVHNQQTNRALLCL